MSRLSRRQTKHKKARDELAAVREHSRREGNFQVLLAWVKFRRSRHGDSLEDFVGETYFKLVEKMVREGKPLW